MMLPVAGLLGKGVPILVALEKDSWDAGPEPRGAARTGLFIIAGQHQNRRDRLPHKSSQGRNLGRPGGMTAPCTADPTGDIHNLRAK